MTFKAGDEIECIDAGIFHLTVGKKYKAIEFNRYDNGKSHVIIEDDDGRESVYYTYRFKLHDDVKEEFHVNYGSVFTFSSLEEAEAFVKKSNRKEDYATISKSKVVKVLKKSVPVTVWKKSVSVPVWEEINV